MADKEPSEVSCLGLLAELSSPYPTKSWQSAPHPHLPIVATATSDKTVSIYSLRDFRLLSTISGGHKGTIRSVAWKDDGKKGESVLATGSFDAQVRIWKREDAYSNPEGGPPGNDIDDDFDLSSAGFVGSESVKNEDVEDWQFAVLLEGHRSEVKSVAFSPSNPSLLATSSRDQSLWLWEAISDEDDYQSIADLTEHSGDVKCVAWHPEDEVLASGSYDDSIRLWRDIEEEGNWGCIGCIEGHEGTVWGTVWEPRLSGNSYQELRLASCSEDLTIRVWRKAEREKREDHNPGALPSIIRPFSSMEVWQEDSLLPRMHSRSIYSIAWSRTTGLMVSCGGDGNIFVYREVPCSGIERNQDLEGMEVDSKQPNTNTAWRVIGQVEGAHGDYEINHVCWAPRQDQGKQKDDEEVILSTGDDGAVRVWSLHTE